MLEQRILNAKEAAKFLNVNKDTVRKLTRRKNIKVIKTEGKTRYFLYEDIIRAWEEYTEKNEIKQLERQLKFLKLKLYLNDSEIEKHPELKKVKNDKVKLLNMLEDIFITVQDMYSFYSKSFRRKEFIRFFCLTVPLNTLYQIHAEFLYAYLKRDTEKLKKFKYLITKYIEKQKIKKRRALC